MIQIAFSQIIRAELPFEKVWYKSVEKSPIAAKLKYAGDFVEKRVWQLLKVSEDQTEKAKRLHELIKKHVSFNTSIPLVDLIDTVKFIEYVSKSKLFPRRLSGNSHFIHPEPNIINFPIQIYSNGHIYIHLQDRDPARKKGGYKTFSKSISYHDETVVANLEANCNGEKDLANLLGEIEVMMDLSNRDRILKTLDYDLIVGFNATFDKESKKRRLYAHKFIFQTPLYDGDLGPFRNDFDSYRKLFKISLQAAKALKQFHKGHWVHRDIKPGNFFYNNINNNLVLVLADFGLAQKADKQGLGESLSGTRGYMAPEICYNRIAFGKSFSTFDEGIKADIFSLGMTFYALQNGRKSNLREKITKINNLALPLKGQKKGSVEEILHAFEDFREVHHTNSALPFDMQNLRDIYLSLSLKMTDPQAANRPDLKEIIEVLEKALTISM